MSNTTTNILSVFKPGKEYNEYVLDWFERQPAIPRKLKIIKNSPWNGWWSKMILFSPEIKGDILYFDIDTYFVNSDITKYENLEHNYFLRDFYKENEIGSGVMYLKDDSTRREVWNDWIKNKDNIIKKYRGDQDYLFTFYNNKCKLWQDSFEKIKSYKVHIRSNQHRVNECDIICFHGKPRPWEIKINYQFTFIKKYIIINALSNFIIITQ